MTQQREAKISTKTLQAFDRLPRCWSFKVHGGPFQRAGIPDILGLIDGRFFAVEMKDPDATFSESEREAVRDLKAQGIPTGSAGGCTKLQALTIRRIIEAGGLAGVATSVDEALDIVLGR